MNQLIKIQLKSSKFVANLGCNILSHSLVGPFIQKGGDGIKEVIVILACYSVHFSIYENLLYDPSNNKSILIKVEEKPDVTYADVGGCAPQITKLREVVEIPLLHPERFVNLGIEPPKVGDFSHGFLKNSSSAVAFFILKKS